MTRRERDELLAEARELEAAGNAALAKVLRDRAANPRPAPAVRLVLGADECAHCGAPDSAHTYAGESATCPTN